MRTKLTKYMQGLCTENDNMLLRKKKDLNRWRDIPCAWFRRLKIIKEAHRYKLMYRLSFVPIKMSGGSFSA